jgi:hypothetical protein
MQKTTTITGKGRNILARRQTSLYGGMNTTETDDAKHNLATTPSLSYEEMA